MTSIFHNDRAGLPRGGAPGERWTQSTKPRYNVINTDTGAASTKKDAESIEPRRGKKHYVQMEEEAKILGAYDQAPQETVRVVGGSGNITNAQNTLVDGFSRGPGANVDGIYQNGNLTTFQAPPKKRMQATKSYNGKNILTMDFGEDHLRVGGATQSPYVPSPGPTSQKNGHAMPMVTEDQMQRMEQTRQLQSKPPAASPLGYSTLRGAGNHVFSQEEAPLTKAQAQEKWIEQKNLAMGIHKKAGRGKYYMDPSEWVDPLDNYVPGKTARTGYNAVGHTGSGAFVQTEIKSFSSRPSNKELPLPPNQHNPWATAGHERDLKTMTMAVENTNSSTAYEEQLVGVDQAKFHHIRSGKTTGDDILEHRLGKNMNKPEIVYAGANTPQVVLGTANAPAPEMFAGDDADGGGDYGEARDLEGGDGEAGSSPQDSDLLNEARERLQLQSQPTLEELKMQGDEALAAGLKNVGFAPEERMSIMWELRRAELQRGGGQGLTNAGGGGGLGGGNRALVGGGIGGGGIPGAAMQHQGGGVTSFTAKPERGYLQNSDIRGGGIESLLVMQQTRDMARDDASQQQDGSSSHHQYQNEHIDTSSPWRTKFSNGLSWDAQMED